MRKNFFWARETTRSVHTLTEDVFLHRFRTMAERDAWMAKTSWAEVIAATDPEVRRIQRRIRDGETITFPVEID